MADRKKGKRKKSSPPPHIPTGRVPTGRVPTGQVPRGQLPTGQIDIKAPPGTPEQKRCPKCATPMSYHGGVGHWYCPRCLDYHR